MIMAGLRKSTAYSRYQFLWQVADIFYPPVCVDCGTPNQRVCPSCLSNIQFIKGDLCPTCGEPSKNQRVCKICLSNPPYFQGLRGLAHYSGPVRASILRLKYESDYGLGEILSRLMVEKLKLLGWQVNLVMSVPLSQSKLLERGYNQADLLARPIAYALNLPFLPKAISRIRETRSQVGLNSEERILNLKNAFSAESKLVNNKSVLLIDDVTTTGTTINECSRALLGAGAASVFSMTLARPLHGNKSNEL